MHISKDYLNNIVLGVSGQLMRVGIELPADALDGFSQLLTSYMGSKCGIEVVEAVSFEQLCCEQLLAWMVVARAIQSFHGVEESAVSSEDTAHEAAALYEKHKGVLPCLPVNGANVPIEVKESIELKSKIAAANCLFDLESGELNEKVACSLSPECIYDAVTLSSSLTISVEDEQYILAPYWPFLTEDNAIEILYDINNSVEAVLLEQYKSMTTVVGPH